MSKGDFNKVAKQRYRNHTSAWVFCCKLAAYFQNIFSQEHLWTADPTNFSKIKLVIYQFPFCCFLFWGNGCLFKRSILICPPPRLGLGFALALGLGLGSGGNFPRGQLS